MMKKIFVGDILNIYTCTGKEIYYNDINYAICSMLYYAVWWEIIKIRNFFLSSLIIRKLFHVCK